MRRESVAMGAVVHAALVGHLLRPDGDEDICLATYAPSSGQTRSSRLITAEELPRAGERLVHGNATMTGEYVLRVAARASQSGQGVVVLHSHPQGKGWQPLSRLDYEAERAYAILAREVTELPLVGMTLAGGDSGWSARTWVANEPAWAESVRVVGSELAVHWNDDLCPPPVPNEGQVRTVSAWGEQVQASLARMKVLVVGVGSVGLDIAQRLAATGLQIVSVMDPDTIGPENRDRMIGATAEEARRRALKTDVAERLMRMAATAAEFTVKPYPISICTEEGLRVALDHDIVFSCVDRPWPRAVLNVLAYADLIPVIDGGIAIDTWPDGGMRSATWRVQSLVPGAPCMLCARQVNAQDITLDMEGLLQDPEYLQRAGRPGLEGSPNVAALCAAVSAAQLSQLVSLVAHPAGLGVPSPLRYIFGAHVLEHLPQKTQAHCPVEPSLGQGDARMNLIRG